MTRHWHHRGWILFTTAVLLATTPLVQAQRRDQGRDQGRDNWQQPARVVNDLNLDTGDVVADIGAGSGYFTFRLSDAVGPDGKVFATEINERGLDSIKGRVKERGIANIETVVSDPANTKLKTESVDAALICNVLHHVPEDQRQPLVTDIARTVKPGGFFFIIDWRVDARTDRDQNRRISKDDLIEMGKQAGLGLDAEFHYLRDQVFLRLRKPEEAERPAEN